MNFLFAITFLLNAGPLFDLQTFPIDNPNAHCFIAQSEDDGAADLFVLDHYSLHIYKHAREGTPRSISLPPNATAVDIADLDGDGAFDVIALCQDKIVRFDLAEAKAEPATLVRLPVPLSLSSPRPFLFVMVIKRDGVPLLALPTENTFDLRAINGDLVASYPIGSDAPRHAAYGRPFSAFNIDPPQTGPPDAFEMRVNRMLAYIPDLPGDILPIETPLPSYRRGTPAQTRQAAQLDRESWPWFPLRRDATRVARVLYAQDTGPSAITLVRIQEPLAGAEGSRTEVRTGPERRYPGMILFPEKDLPDFNNDAYVDLVLWNAPAPAPTVGALTRAALAGTWPIRVTMHLFDPQKRRYTPVPAAQIEMNAPLPWFLNATGAPLRNIVFSDFNGDGQTDFACSHGPDVFSVWSFGEKGFGNIPDFQHRFDETVPQIAFQANLDASGRTSIGLRGDNALYILRAVVAPPPARK